MKYNEAQVMIAKLAKENLTHQEIAKRLEKAGFKSPRTGKSISPMGVGYHVRKLEEETPTPRQASERPTPTIYNSSDPATWKRRTAKAPTPRKVQLAQEILTGDLPIRDKCEVAAAILMS